MHRFSFIGILFCRELLIKENRVKGRFRIELIFLSNESRIPSGWAERINGMDEVWVPTKFQAEVFEQNGVDPAKIVLMPEAVDVDFFNPEDVQMLELDKFAKFYEEDLLERFRFMSIFKVRI